LAWRACSRSLRSASRVRRCWDGENASSASSLLPDGAVTGSKSRALEDGGYSLAEAGDAEEALARLASEQTFVGLALTSSSVPRVKPASS
jgi:hypothetical protein